MCSLLSSGLVEDCFGGEPFTETFLFVCLFLSAFVELWTCGFILCVWGDDDDDDHYSPLSNILTAPLLQVIPKGWLWLFTVSFEYPPKWCTYSAVLFVTWLVPRETAAVSARSVYTIRPCTMSRHFMQSHKHRVQCVFVCLHCWQNVWDPFRATPVTRGWKGYRNKSQHREKTLEKKIHPPFLPGLEPETFRSRDRHLSCPRSINNKEISVQYVKYVRYPSACNWKSLMFFVCVVFVFK